MYIYKYLPGGKYLISRGWPTSEAYYVLMTGFEEHWIILEIHRLVIEKLGPLENINCRPNTKKLCRG